MPENDGKPGIPEEPGISKMPGMPGMLMMLWMPGAAERMTAFVSPHKAMHQRDGASVDVNVGLFLPGVCSGYVHEVFA